MLGRLARMPRKINGLPKQPPWTPAVEALVSPTSVDVLRILAARGKGGATLTEVSQLLAATRQLIHGVLESLINVGLVHSDPPRGQRQRATTVTYYANSDAIREAIDGLTRWILGDVE